MDLKDSHECLTVERMVVANAQIVDTNLSNSTFDNANLASANIHGSNVSNLQVTDCNMSNSVFREVNLSNARIEDAVIAGLTIDGILVSDMMAAYLAKIEKPKALKPIKDVAAE